jgi:hypothetical protein
MYVQQSADQMLECRAKATELRDHATTMHVSDFRQQLLDIAREYDELAAVIEARLLRR